MDSAADPPSLEGVAPFGDLGIKACSRLPQAFRSVPRPSSPLGAKASTRCPCFPRPPAATTTKLSPRDLRSRGGPARAPTGRTKREMQLSARRMIPATTTKLGCPLRRPKGGAAPSIPMPDDVLARRRKTKRRAKTSTCRCPSHARRRRRIAPPQARGRAPHHHLTMSKQQGPAPSLGRRMGTPGGPGPT